MLENGSRLGAYRIIRLLGEGGMGAVYEAEHVELRARRALKVFSSGSEHADFLRRRFAAEGRILADLAHPRVVRVYDFSVDPATGSPYFAMDLIVSPSGETRTLEAACRDGVDEDQVARWFRDVCEGLAYIHAKGVVHRDISLDNILIGPDGRAVLTDFGIARITGESYRRKFDITRTLVLGNGLSLGKGLYMAPELVRGGEATPASDAYALGTLLFRMLVGSWYTSDARLDDALAGMDYNWAEIIGRICAAEPARRLGPGGVAELPALLRKGAPARAARVSARIVLVAVSALLCLAGIVFFLLSFLRRPEAPVDVYHVHDVTNYVSTGRDPQSSEIVTFQIQAEHPTNTLQRLRREIRQQRERGL